MDLIKTTKSVYVFLHDNSNSENSNSDNSNSDNSNSYENLQGAISQNIIWNWKK